ncbi:hypothetical protein B0H16DRAFT_1452697 [Mycena metata]|uniref:Uncharacterized protein n=1 Tax=Mycena metata TaxID=1033252 RepID=A0AAD7JQU1_9AGAR|nr:hypothetical protein B0H16DRAFT_1452697 [Mycena metata]
MSQAAGRANAIAVNCEFQQAGPSAQRWLSQIRAGSPWEISVKKNEGLVTVNLPGNTSRARNVLRGFSPPFRVGPLFLEHTLEVLSIDRVGEYLAMWWNVLDRIEGSSS